MKHPFAAAPRRDSSQPEFNNVKKNNNQISKLRHQKNLSGTTFVNLRSQTINFRTPNGCAGIPN
ncbi:MAG: hypothetical protein KKD78_14520, partial [Proteobacteria bacterium]|nr:hypothetical protein [Pseudomonadota bacterium]